MKTHWQKTCFCQKCGSKQQIIPATRISTTLTCTFPIPYIEKVAYCKKCFSEIDHPDLTRLNHAAREMAFDTAIRAGVF